jgi:hypothetical protein
MVSEGSARRKGRRLTRPVREGVTVSEHPLVPGVVPPSTCPRCGAPLRCCRPDRARGARERGEPAEGGEGGNAPGRAREAVGGAQGSLSAELE